MITTRMITTSSLSKCTGDERRQMCIVVTIHVCTNKQAGKKLVKIIDM